VRELTDLDVAAVPLPALTAEVTRCLADLGAGEASQAPKAVLPIGTGAFFLSIAGVVPRLGLGAAKWASYVPGTAGSPGASTSTVVVSDATTGEPLALVTGMAFTQARTAATAVAVARAASVPRVRDAGPAAVAMVGCGTTNRAVLDAVLAEHPGVAVRVLVRSAGSARALRAALAPVVAAGRLEVSTDPTVVAGADWAFSATGATRAVADLDLLAPDAVAVALDGARTWTTPLGTPVLDDHVRPGAAEPPAVPRLLAGRLARPAGRVLLDVAGSAVCDVALAACLLGAER
jgi:ornithine cyclodeaminase/alanine dehydrogenase-like protein (mu-crystallin family)